MFCSFIKGKIQHSLSSGVAVLKDYESPILEMEANEGKLHQIFLNILTNAIQSIKPPGKVTITTKNDQNGGIMITIRN